MTSYCVRCGTGIVFYLKHFEGIQGEFPIGRCPMCRVWYDASISLPPKLETHANGRYAIPYDLREAIKERENLRIVQLKRRVFRVVPE